METPEVKAQDYIKRFIIHDITISEFSKKPTVYVTTSSRKNGKWGTKIVQFETTQERDMFVETLRNNSFGGL